MELCKKIPEDELSTTYFAIFDADSKPEIKGFKHILYDTSQEKIYQFLSVYSTNYTSISPINQANSILQTSRTFSFELPNLLENFIHQKCYSLMYLIGHGLIIRGDIRKNFPFPETTVTEDIAYGYKMNMHNIFAKPLPFYDYCSVPYHYTHNIHQTSRRFQGDIELYKEVSITSLKNFILLIKRYLQLGLRAFSGIGILFAISITIAHLQRVAVGGFILCGYVEFLSTKRVIRELYHTKETKNLYSFLFIRFLLDGVGPLLGLLTLFFNKLQGKQSVFYKTPKKST